MKQLSVAAGLVKTYINYAVEHGANRAALMTSCALSEQDVNDQDNRIPLDRFQSLVLHAKAATGDPAFVLNHALNTRIVDISVVGLIVHTSTSMLAALSELNRYGQLIVEVDVMEGGVRFDTEVTPDGLWIIDNRPNPNAFPELSEANFGRFVSEFATEFPETEFAKAIEVTHSDPGYGETYERLLQCPVTFDAPRNAMLISSDWLAIEFDSHIGYAFGLFTEKADALLEKLQSQATVRAKIEAHVLPILHKGDVSVEGVASALGMSRQTLYRRLKEENATFASLLDDLRCRMATDYLTARKVSVNETAYLVGFSEASSFVRAFKRWTGQSPAEFRGALAAKPS